MAFLTFFLIGLCLGLVLFFAPALVGEHLTIKWRLKLSLFYFNLACKIWTRILILSKKHGSIEFFSSKYDPVKQAETVNFGGPDDVYFEEPYNGAVSYLHDKECSLCDERASFIFNPMLALIASKVAELVRNGDHKKTFKDPVKGAEFSAFCGSVFIDDKVEVVNCKSITSILGQSAAPGLSGTVRKFVDLSQRDYRHSVIWEAGLAIMFFLTGFGSVAVAVMFLEKNPIPPGIVDTIPIIIGGLL